MNIPEDRLYSDQHEWVVINSSIARVGVTDHAQDALGDVVFVQLPNVGDRVVVGERCCEVESTKSVSDIYAPMSGNVSSINTNLVDNPGLINSDPYGDGWIFEIDATSTTDTSTLLNASEYRRLIEG